MDIDNEIVTKMGRSEGRSIATEPSSSTPWAIIASTETAFSSLKEILPKTIVAIERARDKNNFLTGLSTGFLDLDRVTGGLQTSSLIVVAGAPGMAKTAFCLNIARNVALQDLNRKVGIFSLEMSKEQMMMRFLSSETELEHSKLRTGSIDGQEWSRITRATSSLSNASIFIDDSGYLTVKELSSRARRLKQERGLDLLIVDYVQLMQGETAGERKTQVISEVSASLKILAKELEVPVIAVSQLNRLVRRRGG